MPVERDVTVIVTPREKFSTCRRSLESILANTDGRYPLIYVDGGSPTPVRRFIEERSRERGFRVIRTDYYLTPNGARLRALEFVNTPYVLFIDNDVVVTPGWLEPLVDCAEATGAAIVSPLICQGTPVHEIVHCAGGECGIKEVQSEGATERHLYERIAKQGRRVADVRPKLRRMPTGLAEFHCMLTRTEFARRPGMIDGRILNTREHIDYCMNVADAGGTIYLEPDSIVTYIHNTPLELSDLPYYMLRWSDDWERRSLTYLIGKWNLTTKGTAGYRLKTVGWRRRQYLVTPFSDRLTKILPGSILRRGIRKVIVEIERPLNRLLTATHSWRAPSNP